MEKFFDYFKSKSFCENKTTAKENTATNNIEEFDVNLEACIKDEVINENLIFDNDCNLAADSDLEDPLTVSNLGQEIDKKPELPVTEEFVDKKHVTNSDTDNLSVMNSNLDVDIGNEAMLMNDLIQDNTNISMLVEEEVIDKNDYIADTNLDTDDIGLMSKLERDGTNIMQVNDQIVNNNFTSQNYDISATNTLTNMSEKGKKRGRKRKYESQNREIRKLKSNTNQDYINSKGKEVKKKTFNDFACNCPLKCTEKVEANIRKREFENYWNSGNFSARLSIIRDNIIEHKVIRSYVHSGSKKRTFTRRYFIAGVLVCKKTFLQTYQISASRVSLVLEKMRKQEDFTDNRGRTRAGGIAIKD